MSKNVGNFPKLIGGHNYFRTCLILTILVNPLDVIKFRCWTIRWWKGFLVHFETESFEWLKMQTRKGFSQKWKKCFKSHMVYEDRIIPLKVRSSFEKGLHVSTMRFQKNRKRISVFCIRITAHMKEVFALARKTLKINFFTHFIQYSAFWRFIHNFLDP